MNTKKKLQEMYNLLLAHFGSQKWWPAKTNFEMMAGAILVQNTNWKNAEKALQALKDVNLLSFEKIIDLSPELLAGYIRPAGYYNIKAKRLHNLCRCIRDHADGSVDSFLQHSQDQLRELLLSVNGIGPETADAILLYAAGLPVFVIDTYTYRVLARHQLVDEEADYYIMQELFTDNLETDVALFNEYHALLVQVGKKYCRKSKALCEACPLQPLLSVGI